MSANNTLCIVLLFICSFSSTTATACNGLADLCDLRIDQATFPSSHNAGSGFDGLLYHWDDGAAPSCSYRNHGDSFTGQLQFGIRYFDIDTCYGTGEAVNCHCGSFGCAYTSSIEKGLLQIDSWMKSNPNEVIFIHFNRDAQEGYRQEIARSIESVLLKLWEPNSVNNLAMSTYYKSNYRWPTLREAINSNQRIILFMDNNLSQHITSYDWLVTSNGIIASSWDTNPVSFSCSGITTNAKAKCGTTVDFIILAAFGSYGLCTWDMARLCTSWLGEAQEACYDKRDPLGKTVNFLSVDWIEYYRGEESVVNKAKFMNQKNIKKYLGRDVYFPELSGCSYHAGWFGSYCWKYCSEFGWCWINQYCGNDANVCKQRDYPCYSGCGY